MRILLNRCDGSSPPRKLRKVDPWGRFPVALGLALGTARDGCLSAEPGPRDFRVYYLVERRPKIRDLV
jgi:hypothetical protein